MYGAVHLMYGAFTLCMWRSLDVWTVEGTSNQNIKNESFLTCCQKGRVPKGLTIDHVPYAPTPTPTGSRMPPTCPTTRVRLRRRPYALASDHALAYVRVLALRLVLVCDHMLRHTSTAHAHSRLPTPMHSYTLRARLRLRLCAPTNPPTGCNL